MQPRILLIRLSSLGDIILTMPLIKALREKYPEAQIDLVVKNEFARLAEFFPGLSSVIGIDTKKDILAKKVEELSVNGYTHILDLHNNFRSAKLRTNKDAAVTIVNKRTFKRWMLVKFKINLLKKEPDVIGRYFETAAGLGVSDAGVAPLFDINLKKKNGVAAICPGAKHWNKRWPVEHFQEAAKSLLTLGYRIEFHGSASERALADEIATALPIGSFKNRCGELVLHELPEIFAEIELAITNDSGLMHLASAAGCKTYSIFGPTVREFGFMPRSKNAVVFENSTLDCRPCTTIGLENCPKGHFKCMKEVTAEMVIKGLQINLLQ
jgi:lipopolysaccharide heptosyltransferase II